MVCVVCQECVVKAADGPSPTVSALGCGHTFHCKCISDWFSASSRSECPVCTRVHYGKPISLYLELDDDSAASPNREGGCQPLLQAAGNAGYEELLIDKFGELLTSGSDDQAHAIRRLEDRVDDLELELATQVSGFEERLRLQREMMQGEMDALRSEKVALQCEKDTLQGEKDALQSEVDSLRLVILSDERELSTASLPRALGRKRNWFSL
ncbi:E3 ubiquitin-protein ligase znrf4 [Coemansia helicoidea]|uniref:E3 ubiquitin-protein ligase znrf4 n=1 Tax=Coemansia helicoidea TaxID=1286919 RepID=A0ACC1LFW5_9FUNG|nr:E3 ubiquitin-protein ligase znrf4 [Coemansia helicoidea]